MNTIQALRGMHDLLPDASAQTRRIERSMCNIAIGYGFREIRTPIMESLQLFKRSIGEVTDIVEKEMYVFSDNNAKQIALRPEYTAGCVRAVIEHGLHRQEQKLWYLGPMFRYERPQSGRYRQFTQFGIEHFGAVSPWADINLIAMTNRIWQQLGIQLQLEINCIGQPQDRANYNKQLVAFLTEHISSLDKDSQRRLHTNPLRILDSKDSGTQRVLHAAPQLTDFINTQSLESFASIQSGLDTLGIKWRHNPRLVRGLDYYTDLVFEWTTDDLGSQSAICAGGRYDGLFSHLGSKHSVPGIGCAIGMERLILLLSEQQKMPKEQIADVYFVSNMPQITALATCEKIRTALPDMRIANDISSASMQKQLKRADKTGARWAVVYGEDEAAKQGVTVKNLREQGEQQFVPFATLNNHFTKWRKK